MSLYFQFDADDNEVDYKYGVLCQEQVSRAGSSNYIPQYLWDVITYPCPWCLLLAQHSPNISDNFFESSFQKKTSCSFLPQVSSNTVMLSAGKFAFPIS